tara:strand:+ start:188 stop:475 length:288 start_codon:yes stop_codon:yes gene_type:complete
MDKKDEVMKYLHANIFDPILNSDTASNSLKQGIRLTIMRMNQLDAKGVVQYYWSAIVGTDRSIGFAAQMKQEGYTRFEEIIDEFRLEFNDRWLKS